MEYDGDARGERARLEVVRLGRQLGGGEKNSGMIIGGMGRKRRGGAPRGLSA